MQQAAVARVIAGSLIALVLWSWSLAAQQPAPADGAPPATPVPLVPPASALPAVPAPARDSEGGTAVDALAEAGDTAAADATPAPRAIDAADLSAFVDGLVRQAMKRDGIAGVTVSVVDREGPLLQRGYGIAALAPRREVDPDATLFRIASISKTFTYLLALQLVDEGRLDLDAEVNTYLPGDIRLPDDGRPPVLLRHLFTHTAGFEDSALGHLFKDDASALQTPRDYLREHRPRRVRDPGTRAVYSNYSVALLGALVAHVAGTDFEGLADARLFAPMGMAHTTFREPIGKAGDPRDSGKAFDGAWSTGFERSSGGFAPQAFEFISQDGPAGGASSTAADMGRYMRMLLGEGDLDGRRILSPGAWARLSGEPLFRNAPQVGGFSYGFFRTRLGKVEALGHGGATSWFHSGMVVVPDLGVGVFVSTNTDTGRRFAGELPTAVFERYFADARATAPPVVPPGFDPAPFAGRYNAARANFSRAEKAFMSTTATISAADDRSLVLTVGGDSTRWVPESDLVFREVEGQGRIAFARDGEGAITGFAGALGHNWFSRVPAWDVVDTLFQAMGAAALVALGVLTGAWLRRNRRIRDQPTARFSALWLFLTAFLWLAFAIGVGVYAARSAGSVVDVLYGFPGTLLTVLLWCAPLVILASLVAVLLLPRAWRARDWGFWRKARHTIAVLVFAVAAWLLWHWNLVGWKL